MRRWRIKDGSSFLLLTGVAAPAIGAVIFFATLGVIGAARGQQSIGWDDLLQVPLFLLSIAVLSVPAALFGILFGCLPGMIAGTVLILMNRLRPITFIEVLAVASLTGAVLGIPIRGGLQDPLADYYLGICASIGAVSALAVAPIARRRGIVVLDAD